MERSLEYSTASSFCFPQMKLVVDDEGGTEFLLSQVRFGLFRHFLFGCSMQI